MDWTLFFTLLFCIAVSCATIALGISLVLTAIDVFKDKTGVK